MTRRGGSGLGGSVLGLWVMLALGGCGDDGAGTGGGGGGGQGGGSTGALPSSGVGADPGDPNSPEAGCDEGFVPCGEVCARLEDDSRHCGGCGEACGSMPAPICEEDPTTCGCVAGACVVNAPCPYGPTCDGECPSPGVGANVDHCGACDNRCGDFELCVSNQCIDGDGDGSSCASPLRWGDDETAGFRFAPGVTVLHTFECGPLDPIPTRWFRVTTEDDNLSLELRGGDGDDLILEVFADDSCGDAARVACADGGGPGSEVELDLETSPGSTFWIAVGVIGEWSGEPATLRHDT